MKHSVIIFLTSLFLFSCSHTAEQLSTEKQTSATASDSQAETARLNEWFEARYEEELNFSPIGLTMQGRKERYDEIGDFSYAAQDKQTAWKGQTVADMKSLFDYDKLSDAGRLSWDIWEYQYEQDLAHQKMRTKDYEFHQMTGAHSFLPTFMISFHKVESVADMEAYVARLAAVGDSLEQLISIARDNAALGTRPPGFAYEIVSDQASKILTGKPFTNDGDDAPLLADAKTKIASLLESESIDQKQADEFLSNVEAGLLNKVKPAYEKLIAFIAEDMSNTTKQAKGVSELPDGTSYYNYRLKAQTTTDLSADEIHNLGLSEVARLREEMEGLKKAAGFEGPLADYFAFLRDNKEDRRLFYPNDDKGRQAYIDDASAAIENIKAELPNYFGILPKADLEVRRVESFREQDGAPQHYFSGTPDGSRPGIYYAHLSDMGAMPKLELEVIAYHEGLPGHHMQISIAQELEGVPTFQTQAGFTAYSEGWALYSELLAKEMSNTYLDPYSKFGRVSSEMWRAIRLVVDTGMHAKGWSQQKAVDYFAANSPATIATIEAEVRRYLVLPGQATSYKIGMLEILRLRKLAETELGESFDIKQFHDVVLGGGALPLKLLERRVKQWIDSNKVS